MSLKGTYEATSTSSLWHTSKNDVRENSTHSFPRRKQAYAVKKNNRCVQSRDTLGKAGRRRKRKFEGNISENP